MKRIHIIAAKSASVFISVCISVFSGMPVYAVSAISGSGSGEAIVTLTVPEREDSKDSKSDQDQSQSNEYIPVTDNSGKYDGEEKTISVNVDSSDDILPELLPDYSTDADVSWSGDIPYAEEVADSTAVLVGETKELTNATRVEYKKPKRPRDTIPYIVIVVIAGAVAVGMGVTGGFSALWVLFLGVFFKKKKKHWSGLLTYVGNWAMKVKGNTEGIEDMQDILNSGVTTEELQILMKDTGVETILPANTKMSIDIEGIEKQFEADEEIFYKELSGKTGHCIVTFFNGAAKLNFVVTMELY